MKKFSFKKTGAAVLSAAMALSSLAVSTSVFSTSAADPVKYEFEDGILSGCAVQTAGSERYQKGASGDSFVFLEDGGESAAVTVNVPSTDMYSITLHFSSPYGNKTHNLYVNGVDQGQFNCAKTADWTDINLGSVKLNAGDNEIKIVSSWGWTNIDYITVETASLSAITASQSSCSDPKATEETKNLMSYLASVYGKNIISGQQEIYSGGPHGLETEFEYIKNLTGESPAIRGFDYGNFCNPCFGSDDGSTKRVIEWVNGKNGIATASFHLNVPTEFANYEIGTRLNWDKTTYSEKTDFSPSKAATEGTKENEYYLEALEILAGEFLTLQEKGIPVIWRPLHEAEGGGGETGSWFWWGREGSAAYKKLWIYTYKTLTEKFGCHNLIWEWNSYAFDTSANWYPGDEYVDIIGYDKYNCTNWSTNTVSRNDSAIGSTFYNIMEKYDSKKMVAMAENDAIPALSNLIDEKAGWLYFLPWYDGGSDNINFVSYEGFNTKESLKEIYQSDYCITLDELPANLYKEASEVTTVVTEPTKPTTTTTTNPDDDSFTFEVIKKEVTLKHLDEKNDTLVITIKGAPTASIGGGFGYADGADWVSMDWSGNADSKGNLVAEVDLSDVPAGTKSGEVQVWWSNVWDAATEEGIDQPCEIISVEEVYDGASTTTATATTPSVTTTTTAPVAGTEFAVKDVYKGVIGDMVKSGAKSITFTIDASDATAFSYGFGVSIDSTPWWMELDGTKFTDSKEGTVDVAGGETKLSKGSNQVTIDLSKLSLSYATSDSQYGEHFEFRNYYNDKGVTLKITDVKVNTTAVATTTTTKVTTTKTTTTTTKTTTAKTTTSTSSIATRTTAPKTTAKTTATTTATTTTTTTTTTVKSSATTTTASTTKTSTTSTTKPNTTVDPDKIVYGDANGGGIVTVADAVAVMSYVTNPEEYPLSAAGIANCDVYARGDGINNLDALSIQKYIAQLLDKLPESFE